MVTPVDWVFGIIAIVVVGIAGYYLYNLAQPTVTRKAKVSGKRTIVSQCGEDSVNVHTAYHCTFEFEDGQRTEYDVSQVQYAMLTEGDRGELDTKGSLFWKFRRDTR